MNKVGLLVLLGILLALTSLVSAQSAPPWPHERTDIAPSPRVTWGKLENGLRYAILPNRTPEKLVSLRLLVLTGSLHERDDERGYAHFVEHMAFNGTRNFPAGELVKFLQRGGVSFGPHVNAETSETRTLYKIDLPDATAASMGDSLRVLRDFADGLLFEKSEVERERGVMLSELQARRSVDAERIEAWRRFAFAGTLLPERSPGGAERAIKQATSAGLRAFYDAGYRPERMVLVAVGDFGGEQVERALRAQFATLEARGAARPVRVPESLAKPKRVEAAFRGETRDGVQIELVAVRPLSADATDTAAERLRQLQLDLAREMVGQRLQRITEGRGRLTSDFGLLGEVVANAFRVERAIVAGSAKQWAAVLSTAEQEIRRAMEHGFETAELAVVAENRRALWRAQATVVATASSTALADSLVETVSKGAVFSQADEWLATALAQLEKITVADCQAAWRREWEGGALKIFVRASPQTLTLAPAEIVSAYEQSRRTPVTTTAAAPLGNVAFAYEDFGPPGAVEWREHIADLDVWRVRFVNGVRVNLKRTPLERGQVRFRVRLHGGRSVEPLDQPGLHLWTLAVIAGGLRKHPEEEMQQAMRGHPMGLSLSTNEDACELTGYGEAGDLLRCLQVTAAYLMDPALRAGQEARTRGLINSYYSQLSTTPEVAVQAFVIPFLARGAPRVGLPPHEKVMGYSLTELAVWLKPMLVNAPLELTLVGDFVIDDALAAVARTLGALPARGEVVAETGAPELKFPQPPDVLRYRYPGAAGRSTTLLLDWPVHESLMMTERRRLILLAAVLEDRLRVQIREGQGATYSPEASFLFSETHAGLASLRCRLDVAPKSLERVANRAIAVANDLARRGVIGEELERARAQAIANARQLRASNTYWLDALDDSQTKPGRLDEVRSVERDLAAAAKGEIDALAKRYLTERNLFRFIIEPAPAK